VFRPGRTGRSSSRRIVRSPLWIAVARRHGFRARRGTQLRGAMSPTRSVSSPSSRTWMPPPSGPRHPPLRNTARSRRPASASSRTCAEVAGSSPAGTTSVVDPLPRAAAPASTAQSRKETVRRIRLKRVRLSSNLSAAAKKVRYTNAACCCCTWTT